MSNISKQTHIIGLIGRNIGSSRSPEMHEREAGVLGIPLAYRLADFTSMELDNDELGRILGLMGDLGFSGTNITFPFKQDVIPLLDEITEDAAALGAVNTVKFIKGRKIGHNVDWCGFADNLTNGLVGASFDKIVQVGTGGAGAATAYAALKLGCQKLNLFDIDEAKAKKLKERLSPLFPDAEINIFSTIETACQDVCGIIQASPVGMAAYPGSPVPNSLLKAEFWVADIVYYPEDTLLLQMAREKGCRTLSGGGMAVNQAAAAFEIFTDVKPDRNRMHQDFKAGK